jgi:hypothetical protein
MMVVKQLVYIFALLLILPHKTNAQEAFKIDAGLQWFYKIFPQEKVYVQTDKDQYIAGQSLWFSIYAISYGTPSDISKIVYIQLISPNGNVAAQAKFQMEKGKAAGGLVLADSLRSDVYELRCYTAWMLNFDEHFIFHKTIYIQNPVQQIKQVVTKITDVNHFHIDFLPEGGDLVDGILCNTAFKAIDKNALPVEVTGELLDEQKNQVATLQTVHDGMGSFSFIPHLPHEYSGRVRFNDGQMIDVPLPSIKPFGVVLKVIEQNDSEVNIAIFHRDEYTNQYEDLVLAVYESSGRFAVYPLQIEKGKNIFSIKKTQFTSGILRLSLFSVNGVPLAERVLFLDKKDRLNIGLSIDSLSFRSRSNNQFIIQIKNTDGEKDTANFSVSVTDADIVPIDSLSNNICSSMLLSSELNGYIHNPSYYFQKTDDKVKGALDLIMLTNGWRHFKWEDVMNEKSIELKYTAEREQDLEGEIEDYDINLIKKEKYKLKILIQNEDSSKFIGYAEPDSNGRFILSDYPVKGKSTVFYEWVKGGKGKIKDLKVKLFNNSQDSFQIAPYMPRISESIVRIFKDTTEISYVLSQHKGMLKPVTVRGHVLTKTERVISKYVSNEFMEGRASTIDFINNFYPNNNRMFEFLMGRFPGLTIRGTEDLPVFEYEGMATLHNSASDSDGNPAAVPYFYVNEVLTSWEDVKNIPFSDIALIQFLPPPVAIAPFNGGFRGVITVYLRRGDETEPASGITENYNRYIFNGFNVTREFYSPDYSHKNFDTSVQDNRSTLYWNPNLSTNADGKVHFHFYNSDKTKRYRVVIEGMDKEGRLGYFSAILSE